MQAPHSQTALTRSFSRYCFATAFSFVVNLALTAFLHEIVLLSEEVAFGLALVVMIMVNFLLFRYYIYSVQALGIIRQLGLFFISSLGFRGLEYLGFILIHTWLEIQYLIASAAVLGLSFVVKFFYYRTFVFFSDGRQDQSKAAVVR